MHIFAKKNQTTSLNKFNGFFGGIQRPFIIKNEFKKLADNPPINIQREINLL